MLATYLTLFSNILLPLSSAATIPFSQVISPQEIPNILNAPSLLNSTLSAPPAPPLLTAWPPTPYTVILNTDNLRHPFYSRIGEYGADHSGEYHRRHLSLMLNGLGARLQDAVVKLGINGKVGPRLDIQGRSAKMMFGSMGQGNQAMLGQQAVAVFRQLQRDMVSNGARDIEVGIVYSMDWQYIGWWRFEFF